MIVGRECRVIIHLPRTTERRTPHTLLSLRCRPSCSGAAAGPLCRNCRTSHPEVRKAPSFFFPLSGRTCPALVGRRKLPFHHGRASRPGAATGAPPSWPLSPDGLPAARARPPPVPASKPLSSHSSH